MTSPVTWGPLSPLRGVHQATVLLRLRALHGKSKLMKSAWHAAVLYCTLDNCHLEMKRERWRNGRQVPTVLLPKQLFIGLSLLAVSLPAPPPPCPPPISQAVPWRPLLPLDSCHVGPLRLWASQPVSPCPAGIGEFCTGPKKQKLFEKAQN